MQKHLTPDEIILLTSADSHRENLSQIREHVASCSTCAELIKAASGLPEYFQNLRSDQTDVEFTNRIMRAIRHEPLAFLHPQRFVILRNWFWPIFELGLAFALILMCYRISSDYRSYNFIGIPVVEPHTALLMMNEEPDLSTLWYAMHGRNL